ncbi:P-loop containing nucleoside triphosphate hydrolase protein [Rhizoctonia solani]|nr:P-loop containing nucleoside triphosphate hydrolase protein [Rhizoctonia solani]
MDRSSVYTKDPSRQPLPSFSTILGAETLYIPTAMHIPQGAQPEPLNVLVFGPTGVGKSTIINLLTNYSAQLPVGDSLRSCTEHIAVASVFHKGRVINFFDTPGFDDSEKKPAEHLALIAVCLSELYESAQHKPHIHGVLYVHRITDNRMTGSSITNLRVFRKLIGPHVFKNLVFVTNRWTAPPDPKHIKFEDELVHDDQYFGRAIKAGARGGVDYRILEGSSCSQAQRTLLDLFLEYDPELLQIQRDLIDENKAIGDTEAGQVVFEDLNRFKEDIRKEVENLRQELSELKGDDDCKEEIENEETGLMRRLADAEKQEGLLRSTLAQIRKHPGLIAGFAAGAVGLLGAGMAGVVEVASAASLGASSVATSATAASVVQSVNSEAVLNAVHAIGSAGIATVMRLAGW